MRGDRATDLDRLEGRRFDAVFDSCGYTPEVVAKSAAIAGEPFYAFNSSGSVYAPTDAPVVGEDAGLMELDPEHPVDDLANYGAAKALCERALAARLGDRLAVLRAGLIAGPGDYMDRFPYWVARLARPGPVLCPGDGGDPAQVIRRPRPRSIRRRPRRVSHRRGVQRSRSRRAGDDGRADRRDRVRRDRTGVGAAEFLAEREVSPFADMPLWLPRDHPSASLLRLDPSSAVAAGLTFRPWSETAADTRNWLEAEGRELPFECGLDPDRERRLLAEL